MKIFKSIKMHENNLGGIHSNSYRMLSTESRTHIEPRPTANHPQTDPEPTPKPIPSQPQTDPKPTPQNFVLGSREAGAWAPGDWHGDKIPGRRRGEGWVKDPGLGEGPGDGEGAGTQIPCVCSIISNVIMFFPTLK